MLDPQELQGIRYSHTYTYSFSQGSQLKEITSVERVELFQQWQFFIQIYMRLSLHHSNKIVGDLFT